LYAVDVDPPVVMDRDENNDHWLLFLDRLLA
jgi:hypothetical protein